MTTIQRLSITSSRCATVERKTKETSISVSIDLDCPGQRNIKTDLPFLSHMLDAFACHGRFSLRVLATGDIDVDPHHLIEDCGIVLGQTIFKALNGLAGIQRSGHFTFPMDGSLVTVALDICARRNLVWRVTFGNHAVGGLDPNLFREFFKGLADGLQATIHVNSHYADNDHHVIEAVFKALGRGLQEAISPIETNELLSTKGILDDGGH